MKTLELLTISELFELYIINSKLKDERVKSMDFTGALSYREREVRFLDEFKKRLQDY